MRGFPLVPAAALLALFVVLAVPSAIGDAATFDETAHLPAGLAYLERGDFRLNPEHPPLAKLWAAFALEALGRADLPPLPAGSGALPDQWTFGFETLNGPPGAVARKDPARLLVPARMMMILLGVGMGAIVFAWARALWGDGGGLLALALYALSPTMLAHARLVTTDLPGALGFLATAWCAWRWTRGPTLPRAALVGVVFGLALLAKFSTLVIPLLLAPAIVLAVRGRGTFRLRRFVGAALLAALVAWATVWAGYGFRWSAAPERTAGLRWDAIAALDDGSAGVRLAFALRDTRAVPEAYAFGLAHTSVGAGRRLAFLDGETSNVGWWSYFPRAFVLKTPLAILALIAAAAAFAVRRLRPRAAEAAFLVVPVLGYFALSTGTALNLGHRHLAPIYPFLFVGCGALARVAQGWRGRAAIGIALAGLATATFAAAPGYLSFFNVVGGGPRNGWRHLVDSNIDWGQDLGRLADVIRSQGLDRVHLAYFGTADPDAYRLPYRKFVLFHDFRPSIAAVEPGPGDVLAISVTLLQGLYLDPDREFAVAAGREGRIDRPDVDAWLALRDRESRDGRDAPALADWLVTEDRIAPDTRDRLVDGLRSSWIARIRDRLEPFARAGDSILLYRMPEGQDHRSLRDPTGSKPRAR